MSTPLEITLAALRALGIQPKRAGKSWSARCPAHEDKRPSLSIDEGSDGRALMRCHAGCDFDSIVRALALEQRDLMPERESMGKHAKSPRSTKGTSERKTGAAFPTAERAIEALDATHGPHTSTWSYTDASGAPIEHVVRWDSNGSKDYRPVSLTAAGQWIIGARTKPRTLYRLPEVLAGRGTHAVHVLEGEKACDAARELGLVATTSPGGSAGASCTDWSPLAGADVVIHPDNDTPGERYAADVARLLTGIAKSVRIVRHPRLPPKGDIADLVSAAGEQHAELRREIEALVQTATAERASASEAPHFGPNLVRVADVESKPIEWVWPGRIAVGKLSLVMGDPGLGKSLTTLDIASRVTRGDSWPDGRAATAGPSGVLLLSVEDDVADTIRPRLEAAGAHLSRVSFFNSSTRSDGKLSTFTLGRIDDLEAAIRRTPGCRLVVIDPLSAFLGGVNSHHNADVRALLAPLSELAARLGVAIVAVTHLNKGAGSALYRASGSLAFTAAARSVWLVCVDREAPELRQLLPVKNNLGDDSSGLSFRVVNVGEDAPPRIEWAGKAIRVRADEALKVECESEERRTEIDDAAEFIRDVLLNGPGEAKAIIDKARELGISGATLRRAKRKLGVKATRAGFGLGSSWKWSLPDEDAQPAVA
jgi:hypothetical protein